MQQPGLEQFKGKIFYCGKNEVDDCFNHLIGLPIKNDNRLPLFDYEKQVFGLLQSNIKYIWICKATGLGISEFFLRYIAWKCLYNDEWKNCKVVIVTGPRIDLAITLIDRLKKLFLNLGITFDTNQTVIELNGCRVEAFPSHHVDTARGLTDVKFLLLDEAAFFTIGQQAEVRDASERYIGKSDPFIVMISTPNRPDDMFAKIREEEPSLYHRLYFSYHVGLNKIYTPEEIQEAKRSPSFAREYDLKFLGKIGNVFPQTAIDKAIELGEQLVHLPVNQYTHHFGGIDPGFSKVTPLYIGELDPERKIVRIIHCELFDNHSTPEQVANRVHELHGQFINLKWFIDGSNRGFINQLKTKFGESLLWNKPEEVFPNTVRIVPVNFVGNHRKMLEHTFLLVSDNKVAIPKKYDRLITALRTAQAEDYNLRKEDTVNDDDLDSLRLLLIGVKYGARQ